MSKRHPAILIAVLLIAPLPGPDAAAGYERPGKTIRVSVASDGTEQRSSALSTELLGCRVGFPPDHMDMSANGRFVVFNSDAANLVTGDRNEVCDVFVHDLKTRETTRVSVDSNGSEVVGACPPHPVTGSGSPSISENGRYVAFASCAPTLAPGDSDAAMDIFVHDRHSGKTIFVSPDEGPDSPPFTVQKDGPAISANGRFVSYSSYGAAFVRDLRAGKTEIVSLRADGEPTTSASYVSLSASGRYVAYSSVDPNIVTPDINNTGHDSFVFDRITKKTERVTEATDGTQAFKHPGYDLSFGTNNLGGRSISADGRYVVFNSHASNLIPNDANGGTFLQGHDIFVKDRKTDRVERVSVTSHGEEFADEIFVYAGISGNGRFIVFKGDNSYVYDRSTGVLHPLNRDPSNEPVNCGREGHDPLFTGPLDHSGRLAMLMSSCSSLVKGDTNDTYDFFVRDLGPVVGTGGMVGGEGKRPDPPDDELCITPEICVPPLGVVSSEDESANDVDVVTQELGGDLRATSLAYRPAQGDVFLRVELEKMPSVFHVPTATAPAVAYSVRFEAAGRSYEVSANASSGGTFELFDCTAGACTKSADLRGGYGTTGVRVDVAVPLDLIGLKSGGDLRNVVARSELTPNGAVLDKIRLEP